MEMRATENVGIGRDLTPPLPPIASSLYDTTLLSHCSACFSPLSSSSSSSPIVSTFPNYSRNVPTSTSSSSVLYCSASCSASDSPLHFSSAEHHLLLLHSQSHPSTCPFSDTSDLRTALRLLRHLENSGFVYQDGIFLDRIGGLLSNREKMMTCESEYDEEDVVSASVRDGARAMAMARRTRDGFDLNLDMAAEESVVMESVLGVVLTNAVEVQDKKGCSLGIAVYDTSFSWINHSCSPNACYRFSLLPCSGSPCRSLLAPADTESGGEVQLKHKSSSRKYELKTGPERYGPRIIARSIKAIKEGEEVTIAYTDLLQPKVVRKSELWLKYRFNCCCKRCTVLPPTYVDLALQEIFPFKVKHSKLGFDDDFNEKISTSLMNCLKDAVTDYLSIGNPESCCEKLENMLIHGLSEANLNLKEEKCQQRHTLHPLHHVALNAFTTLASAYKIRASNLLGPNIDVNINQLEAFNCSRTSAAYALLLAVTTHHLFLSETSLIGSVENFWTSAGESLVILAKSSFWNLLADKELALSTFPLFLDHKCCGCALMEKLRFKDLSNKDQNSEFQGISKEFHNCMTTITTKVWQFLIHGSHYLEQFRDLINFGYLGTPIFLDLHKFSACLESTEMEGTVSGHDILLRYATGQERINLFKLGIHCILYGCFLSSICYGQDSHMTCNVQNVLFGESKSNNEICESCQRSNPIKSVTLF